MKLNKYYDFITESKLSLILEANMKYSDNFINILSKLKSPISKQILDLKGKDVDVSTNYIDLTDKDDTIGFIPDNRSKNFQTKVKDGGETYSGLTDLAINKNLFGIKMPGTPRTGQIGTIQRELTVDELNGLHESNHWKQMYDQGRKVIHFRWTVNGTQLDALMGSDGVTEDFSNITKSEIKVGRFVKRLLDKAGIKPSDKEIEEFVNQFRSRIEIEKDVFRLFEIVKGDDIKKWYHEGIYTKTNITGTLWQSCMRYTKCQNYFKIYTSNPDQVSLIILKEEPKEVEHEFVDEKTGEKTKKLSYEEPLLRGRALLWTDNRGRKFMDRVYFTKESDVELFKQYAIKNGFIYKEKQENDENTRLVQNNVLLEDDDNTVTVKLSVGGYFNRYPYLDTLKYYSPSDGILSNSDDMNYESKLEDTNGGNCDTCGGSGRVECPECGGDGTQRCGDCDGDGELDCGECEGSGNVGEDENGNDIPCPDCKGSGKENCTLCNGSGNEECEMCGGSGETDCYECN